MNGKGGPLMFLNIMVGEEISEKSNEGLFAIDFTAMVKLGKW
jgi:hypothetical protein